MSYIYDLPVPGHSFFHNQVFQGWSVGGIITYQSGLPFSVTDSTSGGAYGNTGGGTATFLCANAQDVYTRGRFPTGLNTISIHRASLQLPTYLSRLGLELPGTATLRATPGAGPSNKTGISS